MCVFRACCLRERDLTRPSGARVGTSVGASAVETKVCTGVKGLMGKRV